MSNPLQIAAQSVRDGRVDEALAILHRAGDAGNADALAQLAVWFLSGIFVARDLSKARTLLRRAVAIGQADAALMEIALTANGSGAAPDWQEAVRLLEQAARSDTIAAQYLQLLEKMALHPDGAPRELPQPSILHTEPNVRRFARLCTPEECVHIASLAAPSLQPATVFDPASGKMIAHPIRSSDNAVIGPMQETLVVQAINRRIAAATDTQVAQGEPLTVLRYNPGQQYRPHLDTLSNERNQRIRTAILYLNDGYAGGETAFPLLGLEVPPGVGDLLVFDNVDAEGAPDPNSRHAGLPVTSGTKWIATRWLRARPTTAWELSEQARAAARG
ncbi:2OG-Fe(II) oxygenase [Sphingomonas psychrotolerans]|uniref:2OG-Fe(II) oxygenase n=1 Tax=Sphingomonas psychrotolerans TaxID=1327635 RepID=A0ABU3N9G3_9SPHN|nr:2OG-Fe(II) oxygenase [Sphingomonas psychrotolerans]MDT8761118.1 2OG-Fe(II) oxygenase [Sphingomonas psychrotolerans]